MRRSPAVTTYRSDRDGSPAKSSRRCGGPSSLVSAPHASVAVTSTSSPGSCVLAIGGDPTGAERPASSAATGRWSAALDDAVDEAEGPGGLGVARRSRLQL